MALTGAMPADGSSVRVDRVLVLEPGRADAHYWSDLWRFRELFAVLAWRDIAVRYKQTAIGVLWAVVRPLLSMAILTVIFGRLAQLPSEGEAPYALMVLAGTLPWMLFSTALTDASGSLVGNANLISKVYFPRMIVPTSACAAAVADFLVSVLLMVGLMAYFGIAPSWRFLLLPVLALAAMLASLGPGLWMTALNVKYRDFRYIIPFIVQFGLYVSPVGYSSSVVPERWQALYALNPMVGIIDGFRWVVLGDGTSLNVSGLATGGIVIVLFLWTGVRRFRRMEKSFADII